jgi:predicted DCC family thiol-disulfide oxidoreductase YuxK
MFSKFTTYGMLVWQIGLLPLVLLSRLTRVAAIVWGAIFFTFSAYVLAIKTLGTYEYVLFVLIFWSHAWIDGRGRRALMIFFDDRCNLCDRTVKILAAVDLFHRLEFRPLSINVALARHHGVSEDEALTDLVGVTPGGRIYRGYDLYRRISATVALMLPLWPLLFLGQALRLGPLVYRLVADRRRRLFGVCALGSHEPRMEWVPATLTKSSVTSSAVSLTFLVLFVAYAVRLPLISNALPQLSSVSRLTFGRSPLAFGLGMIDVFNEADLKLYRHVQRWELIGADGKIVDPSSPSFSETMYSLLTQDLRVASQASTYCSVSWGDQLATFYANTPAAALSRVTMIRTRFFVSTHPSRDDLLAYRYVPLTWEPTCTTYASTTDPAVRRVEYPR